MSEKLFLIIASLYRYLQLLKKKYILNNSKTNYFIMVSECAEKWDKDALSSDLCHNKHLAQLHMMSTFDATMAMYVIYPQVCIISKKSFFIYNYKHGRK